MPRTCLPYMFFSLMTSNSVQSASSGSLISAKGSSSFWRKLAWLFRLSREMPYTSAPAVRKSCQAAAKSLASFVQPGVLSFG